jgi:hypothetical protein
LARRHTYAADVALPASSDPAGEVAVGVSHDNVWAGMGIPRERRHDRVMTPARSSSATDPGAAPIVRGSFGWWVGDYELGPAHVTATRTWRPATLAPMLLVAIALLASVFASLEPHSQDATPVILGTFAAAGCLVVGLSAAVSLPWRRPRSIRCTRDGIAIDDTWHERREVRAVHLAARTRRVKGRTELAVGIAVAIAAEPTFRTLWLWRRKGRQDTEQIERVVRAMQAMLASAPDDALEA